MWGEEHVLHEFAPDTTKGPRPTANVMNVKTNIGDEHTHEGFRDETRPVLYVYTGTENDMWKYEFTAFTGSFARHTSMTARVDEPRHPFRLGIPTIHARPSSIRHIPLAHLSLKSGYEDRVQIQI